MDLHLMSDRRYNRGDWDAGDVLQWGRRKGKEAKQRRGKATQTKIVQMLLLLLERQTQSVNQSINQSIKTNSPLAQKKNGTARATIHKICTKFGCLSLQIITWGLLIVAPAPPPPPPLPPAVARAGDEADEAVDACDAIGEAAACCCSAFPPPAPANAAPSSTDPPPVTGGSSSSSPIVLATSGSTGATALEDAAALSATNTKYVPA